MTGFPPSQFLDSTVGVAAGACFLGALLLASVSDLRSRRIPNRLVMVLGLLGTVYSVLAVGFPLGATRVLLSCVIGFALWIPFYAFRMLGAGDVKLFAAASCWLAPSQVFSAALLSAFAGGLLSLVGLVIAHGLELTTFRIAHMARDPKLMTTPLPVPTGRRTLPYGIAMAIGLLIVAWFPRLVKLV
jgi:prepilin peptidase CpaA